MAQMAHIKSEDLMRGNTSKRIRSRGFKITINNFTNEDELSIKNIEADKWIYQIEQGESGTPHIEGFIYFKIPKDVSFVKKWLSRAHIEVAKHNDKSITYCSKAETRIRGPYTHNIELPKTVSIISELNEWQQEVIKLIDTTPDNRSIYWYYDPEGNKGKTSLCKYICVTRRDAIYLNGGRAGDMKYAITKMKTKPRIILIDMPRTREGNISWEGIEEIKNGIFFNGKYESEMVIYDCPHVICFANFKPITSVLSEDRWIFKDI